MTPLEIVRRARTKGLDIIGICDHNSAGNVPYVVGIAESEGIKAIPGLEITSSEEIHILTLFGNVECAMEMENLVLSTINEENNEDLFGIQVVVNEKNEVIRFEKKLLIGASGISINRIVDITHSLGGIAIASHVDKEAFSIIAKLGFIPEGLQLDGLEVSRYGLQLVNNYPDFAVVSFSDAHFPEEIGSVWTSFYIEEPSLEGIREALRTKRGIMING